MNTRQIVLALVALDFLAMTVYVVANHGYVGMFADLLSTWPGILTAFDLTIALVMIAGWMLVDARKHGLTVAPYLVATLAFGSLGPLAYLLRRESALKTH
ncbi:hypothetical protein [Nannocystis bainbridge]|uniref:DUF2834 domain-containing protein n=1 Tax=Nannocystis bainbridge TaxID=2995303 RepID=A0ABT5DWR7_9BACT|nr:hypothetical protein [Nannocystis bainbridge]MDC0718075.1 hypothetical protein [Nannocystis bainbridge]